MLSATFRCFSIYRTGMRTYARGRRFERTGDPGIQRRTKAFRDSGIDVPPDADLEQLLEESEAELNNMHFAYNQYEKESKREHEKLKRQIVHRKYSDDEPMPNLLTWSEKEQIRYLATEKADEWSPERIAESFPVTPEVVKKLIKYPWRPSSIERVARHDNSALRNWKQLKAGELDIPEELRQRFLKFSDRKIPTLNESSIKPDIPKQIVGEFQAIIEKSAAKEREKILIETKKKEEEIIKNDVYIEQSHNESSSKNNFTIKKNKIYTLDQLKSNISNKISKGQDVDELERYIATTPDINYNKVTPIHENTLDIVNQVKKDLTVFVEDPKANEPVKILDRIRIPKAAYKKGRTYRVNDCYYDYDGRFLYRVPGISETSGINN